MQTNKTFQLKLLKTLVSYKAIKHSHIKRQKYHSTKIPPPYQSILVYLPLQSATANCTKAMTGMSLNTTSLTKIHCTCRPETYTFLQLQSFTDRINTVMLQKTKTVFDTDRICHLLERWGKVISKRVACKINK